jgi:hypothetical protein
MDCRGKKSAGDAMKNSAKIFFGALIFSSVLFWSCKSSGVEEISVDMLSVLDDDSSIYLGLPASRHKELVSRLLSARISGLSEKNALSLAERTEILYAGLGTVEDRSRMQMVSDTNVPKIAVNSALTKKNGWEKSAEKVGSFSFDKYENSASSFQMALCPQDLVCAGQDVEPLLKNFAALSEAEDSECNRWISGSDDDIKFFISRPGQYLRSLIGQSINAGTECIYGTLSYVADKKNPDVYSEKYDLTFFIRLTEKRSVVALRSLLALSFAMTGGEVAQTDEKTLKLSGVEVTASQIVSMFSRDPITGKHYKVVDDQVVEESVKK